MNITDQFSRLMLRAPDSGATAPSAGPRHEYLLSRSVTFGDQGSGGDAEVILDNPRKNIRKVIVNQEGCFEDFPGIVRGEWEKQLAINFDFDAGMVCFRTSFEWCEWGYRCLWEIQPDGRYWEDEDGYGAESDLQIILYADLDEDGNFMGPFRVYEIGGKRQTGGQEE